MKRLFLALMLPEALGSALHQRVGEVLGWTGSVEARLADGPVRPVRPDGIHLTLHFLGRVRESQEGALVSALGDGLAGLRAPRTRLGRTGAFPARGRERVLWVGVREAEPGGLEGLRERVLGACDRAGLERGRGTAEAFVPHLTVARVRRGPGVTRLLVPDEFYALEFDAPWDPRELCLVESVPSSAAGVPPRYRVVERFPVGSG